MISIHLFLSLHLYPSICDSCSGGEDPYKFFGASVSFVTDNQDDQPVTFWKTIGEETPSTPRCLGWHLRREMCVCGTLSDKVPSFSAAAGRYVSKVDLIAEVVCIFLIQGSCQTDSNRFRHASTRFLLKNGLKWTNHCERSLPLNLLSQPIVLMLLSAHGEVQ